MAATLQFNLPAADLNQWQCPTCLLKWQPSVLQCQACETLQPGIEAEVANSLERSSPPELVRNLSGGPALSRTISSSPTYSFPPPLARSSSSTLFRACSFALTRTSSSGFGRGNSYVDDAAPGCDATTLSREVSKVLDKLPGLPGEATGHLFVHGSGECDQLGLGGSILQRRKPAPISKLSETPIQYVVCGSMHTVCRSIEGKLLSWGCNDDGALGRMVGKECEPHPVMLPSRVVARQIACGDCHTCVIDDSGKVWLWGAYKDSSGYIGVLDASGFVIEKTCTPAVVAQITDSVTCIAAGANHTLALTSSGQIYTWGSNQTGQLGLPNGIGCEFVEEEISKLDMSKYCFCECEVGGVCALLSNDPGSTAKRVLRVCLSTNDCVDATSFTVKEIEDKIETGIASFVVEASQGSVDISVKQTLLVPQEVMQVRSMHGSRFVGVFASSECSFLTSENESAYGCGLNGDGQVGLGFASACVLTMTEIPGVHGASWLGGGVRMSAALIKEEVFTWGKADECGQGFGPGSPAILRPAVVPNLPAVRVLRCGTSHTLACTKEGDVFSWGCGLTHQLGNLPQDASCTHDPNDESQDEFFPYRISSNNLEHRYILLADGGAQHSVELAWDNEHPGGTELADEDNTASEDQVVPDAEQDDDIAIIKTSADFWRVQLEAIYLRRNPYKMENIPSLLRKYEGQEAVLYTKVCKKYCLNPTRFYTDPSAWDEDEKEVIEAGEDHVLNVNVPDHGLTGGGNGGVAANNFRWETSFGLGSNCGSAISTHPASSVSLFTFGAPSSNEHFGGTATATPNAGPASGQPLSGFGIFGNATSSSGSIIGNPIFSCSSRDKQEPFGSTSMPANGQNLSLFGSDLASSSYGSPCWSAGSTQLASSGSLFKFGVSSSNENFGGTATATSNAGLTSGQPLSGSVIFGIATSSSGSVNGSPIFSCSSCDKQEPFGSTPMPANGQSLSLFGFDPVPNSYGSPCWSAVSAQSASSGSLFSFGVSTSNESFDGTATATSNAGLTSSQPLSGSGIFGVATSSSESDSRKPINTCSSSSQEDPPRSTSIFGGGWNRSLFSFDPASSSNPFDVHGNNGWSGGTSQTASRDSLFTFGMASNTVSFGGTATAISNVSLSSSQPLSASGIFGIATSSSGPNSDHPIFSCSSQAKHEPFGGKSVSGWGQTRSLFSFNPAFNSNPFSMQPNSGKNLFQFNSTSNQQPLATASISHFGSSSGPTSVSSGIFGPAISHSQGKNDNSSTEYHPVSSNETFGAQPAMCDAMLNSNSTLIEQPSDRTSIFSFGSSVSQSFSGWQTQQGNSLFCVGLTSGEEPSISAPTLYSKLSAGQTSSGSGMSSS